jgi:uroporphyrin-III C-methyltransferase
MSDRRRKQSGKVYLVGSGPGDSSLLTVRARDLILSCKHIVYDALIGDDVRGMIPAGAKKYDAGKRGGKHRMEQEEINTLLLKLALSGKDVIRLKGGDPFIFGRGAEEVEFLQAHGIRVEIVPGVSSAIAGPELAGIPLTKRGVSDRVLIISARGTGGRDINWKGIYQDRQTAVFLMGLSSASEISTRLKEEGMPSGTPVAVIFGASLPRQQTVITDLEGLKLVKQRGKGNLPALIVVGPAVSFRLSQEGESAESGSTETGR